MQSIKKRWIFTDRIFPRYEGLSVGEHRIIVKSNIKVAFHDV